jgi:hypothetical protein
VSSQLHARAFSLSFRLLAPGPVVSLCEPRATASPGPVLRACLVSASRSVTQLSDGRRCGQGRTRALWRGLKGMRPSASASEAVSGAQRSTFSLEALRICRAMCASANRELEDGSEDQSKAGRRWWRPSARVYRSISQSTPRRKQNLAYILFHRARARIPKNISTHL